MSEAASTPPMPSGLIPTVLRLENSKLVPPTELSLWYVDHIVLIDSLLHAAMKMTRLPYQRKPSSSEALARAHAALHQHAAALVGDDVPVVQSRSGRYTIPYDKLAESRSKVKILSDELALAQQKIQALNAEGWRPSFDGMSPSQEELLLDFCTEIGDEFGQNFGGFDPVRLLEMAEALYEAERTDLAPSAGEAS